MDDTPADVYDFMPYLTSNPHGNWVNFTNAMLTMPVCTPCRATLFTGHYATRHGVIDNVTGLENDHAGLDPQKLLARTLQRKGYTTGLFGKYINGYPWDDLGNPIEYVPPGWNEWRAFRTNNGSGDYYDFTMVEQALNAPGTAAQVVYNAGEYCTDIISGHAETFVTNATEPFFAYVPHWAPHDPAEAAPRHATLYDATDPANSRSPNFNEADISDKAPWYQAAFPSQLDAPTITSYDTERKNMWRALKAVDEGIEDIITALDARGVLDNTVIVVMADNGHMLGEHRYKGKPSAWEENLNARLRVRWPGATQGDNDALVANIDIAPTLADIAGGRMPDPPDGMSFVPLLDGTLGPDSWREDLLLEREAGLHDRRFYGVRTRTAKFVEYYHNGQTERYDLTSDPYELSALTGDGGLARRADTLRAATQAST